MNSLIANIFKGYLENLTWHDKLAGIVQTASINVKNGPNSIEGKTFPISCDIDIDACLKGAYQDLAPDSKKKSILYFEDKGVSFVERQGNRMKFQSSLRLVGWLNLKLIQEESCDSGVTSCSDAGRYVINVLQVLPTVPFHTTDFVSIQIVSIAEVERDVSIFSKYSYSETATQYLLFPFSFFALDFLIDFVIPCIERP
jgi:hypothetical protein